MTALDDEVARLRETPVQHPCEPCKAERDALRAENEALRLANAAVVEVQQANLAERDAYSNELFTVREENDALRAENERLRLVEHDLHSAQDARDIAMASARSRGATIAELRASLADAVGRMGRMEKVVDAAIRHWKWGSPGGSAEDLLGDAIDAYEASLPGLVAASPNGGDAP